MAGTATDCLMFFRKFCPFTAPAKNAHDIIMAVNDVEFSKRNANQGAAEDNVVKINEGDGLDLLEGDMKLSAEEYKAFYGEGRRKRNILLDRRSSWRTRIIPYVIEHDFPGKRHSSTF